MQLPDWASMCKHVAAVLYGIGARLDERPELLFKLRKVDEKDLIAKAGRGIPLVKAGPAPHKVLGSESLSELFGLEIDADASVIDATARPYKGAPGAKNGSKLKNLVAKQRPEPTRSRKPISPNRVPGGRARTPAL